MSTYSLDHLTDQQLIKNIRDQVFEDASINELQKRHGGILTTVYNYYQSTLLNSGVNSINTGHKYGDAKRVIWEAALSFDETKNSKYSTWLYNTARFQCLNAIRESSKEICYEPEFMSVYIDNDQNERAMDEINMNELELIEKAKEFIARIKEPHGRQLMTMRYLQNRPDGKKYTWKEIAAAINYTQQHVHNLHNKYLSELTKFLSYTNEYNAQLAA